MKKLSVVFLLAFIACGAASAFSQTKPYTPEKGSTERKAILNAVRKYRKAPTEVYSPTVFNVSNGWAYVAAEDPNEPGIDTMAFDVVLRKTAGKWKVVDRVSHLEGTNYLREITRIRRKFPSMPRAILPSQD